MIRAASTSLPSACALAGGQRVMSAPMSAGANRAVIVRRSAVGEGVWSRTAASPEKAAVAAATARHATDARNRCVMLMACAERADEAVTSVARIPSQV